MCILADSNSAVVGVNRQTAKFNSLPNVIPHKIFWLTVYCSVVRLRLSQTIINYYIPFERLYEQNIVFHIAYGRKFYTVEEYSKGCGSDILQS